MEKSESGSTMASKREAAAKAEMAFKVDLKCFQTHSMSFSGNEKLQLLEKSIVQYFFMLELNF